MSSRIPVVNDTLANIRTLAARLDLETCGEVEIKGNGRLRNWFVFNCKAN